MTTQVMKFCLLTAAVALSGCSAERWTERDAQTRCERMLAEVLPGAADVALPAPTVEPAPGGDGHLVTWAPVQAAAAGPGGAPGAASARCQFDLEGEVAWIELDGERIYDPLTGTDAIRAQRDEAAAGADDDTVR